MSELQVLYNQLFYDELKEKISIIIKELKLSRSAYNKETQNSLNTMSGFLNVGLEDLGKLLSQQQDAALKNINDWVIALNNVSTNGFKEQTALLETKFLQQTNLVETVHHALEEWREHLNAYKNQMKGIEFRIGTIGAEIMKKEEALYSKLEFVEKERQLQFQNFADEQRKVAVSIQQMVKETKAQSNRQYTTIQSHLDKNKSTLKMSLYGLIGTQLLLIIMGAYYFFTK